MLVRSISCVLIFLSAFVIARAWIVLSAVLTRLVTEVCVAVLSLCVSCSALLTTMSISVIEAVIRSSGLCSNFDAVVCIIVWIFRIWFFTMCIVACSLLMVAIILLWKSSAVMSVVVIFLL